jgi:predicted regulator of Ras-like GTPase activity (Roadblock/LC7/MglB family)
MDAQQALADLTEISSQIRAAVVFDENGAVAGSTLEDSARADELARGAAELLAVADGIKGDGGELTQLEAATEEGSVFVVRQAETRIAATTGVDPTVGLVFYDLKSALRNLDAPKPAPKRKPAPKKPAAKKAPDEAAKRAPAEKKAAAKPPASRARKAPPKPKSDAS